MNRIELGNFRKNLGRTIRPALAGLAAISIFTACDSKPSVVATPTPSGNVGTVHLESENVELGPDAQRAIVNKVTAAIDKAVAERPTPTPTAAVAPRPTETPRPVVVPEIRPDWTKQPVSSEIYVPYSGTTINRTVGPNQIVAISGGPMTLDYLDRNGYRQTLSFPGGSDTVTLAFFLGDQRQINPVSVRGVVPFNNWVGTYYMPDQNPTNPQNWQALIGTKVLETQIESSSVPGGARFVDVVVIDGGSNHIVYQNRIAKQ